MILTIVLMIYLMIVCLCRHYTILYYRAKTLINGRLYGSIDEYLIYWLIPICNLIVLFTLFFQYNREYNKNGILGKFLGEEIESDLEDYLEAKKNLEVEIKNNDFEAGNKSVKAVHLTRSIGCSYTEAIQILEDNDWILK